MLSIGALSSAAQGASYYERDGYYAKDDPEHRDASAWAGKGAEELGLKGPVDAETFRAVLEGKVPDGSGTELGRRGKDGEIHHRPGRDLTFSAPKSVSIAALVGGDRRIVEAHDRAVAATLAWVEKNAAETRMKDPDSGSMARVGGQKIVAAAFRHDTSRNLDPQLHTHAVLANMVQGEDGKWRSMANEGLYAHQKLIGTLYRNELAASLVRLGYGVEKTHADGRFEIAGVSREAVEAFSTRRAEIEAAMNDRALGATADNPRLAERAALMTRAAKRDIDREELRGVWRKQATNLGLDASSLVSQAVEISDSPVRHTAAEPAPAPGRETRLAPPAFPEPGGTVSQTGVPFDDAQTPERETASDAAPSRAAEAAAWAMAHLSERAAVFSRADLFAAVLAHAPGAVSMEEAERAVAALERDGVLHAVNMPGAEDSLATDRTVGEERETVAQMRLGEGAGPRSHARLGGAGASQQGPAHGRPEGRREAHPVGEGPHGRRPGLCRYRQDDHAEPGQGARGEEGLAHGGPRAVGLGGADARLRSRHRDRDPAALPCAQCRRRRGQAHEEGREGDARRLREDDPGGRRGLARLHRAGKGPAAHRQRGAHPPGRSRRRREAARRRRCRQALRPAPGRRHADRHDGRDHAPARSRPEGGRRGKPPGRCRPRLREARRTMLPR